MSAATSLYALQIEILRIGGPILIGIGTISCLLNLMVFTKATLRRNPCAMYFIILNIINILYFYLGLLLTVLAVGFNIDPSTSNLIFCRFRYYMAAILACWQSSCLVLAAVDRTLITSPNVRTRQRSTCRLMAVCSLSVGIFWPLENLHAWFFTDILQFGPGYFVCFYRPGLYNSIVSYHAVIVNGILPSLLLIVFGCWTVRNVRQIRKPALQPRSTEHSAASVHRPHMIQSKDRQLIRILIVDITTYIICKLPVAIMFLYQQITQYDDKSSDQQLIEQSVLQLTFFWYFFNNGIGCYTNLFISKTYRAELKDLLASVRLLF